eukprot:TRINITY_DN7190_c0_g2_i1.p1 TRINITY_DN7190_c0_g2~~TRINITY_DN7190_c0_g2_i1.p1  ORF type:complete len:496 (+),score=54.95 TRINITY_DN7190_c0_g2_i1:208-1695(+)
MENRISAEEARMQTINNAIRLMASVIIFLVFGVLLYYNFVMIYPHLPAFFWAITTTLCLSYVKDNLLNLLEIGDEICRPYKLVLIPGTFLLWFSLMFFSWFTENPLLLIFLGAIIVSELSLLFLNRHTLVSAFLVLVLLFVIAFPTFWLIQRCFIESKNATIEINNFLTDQKFVDMIRDYEKWEIYQEAVSYASSWGYEPKQLTSEHISGYVVNFIKTAGNQLTGFFGGLVTFTANVGNFMFDVVIYISCTFFFLAKKDVILIEIGRLSPFSTEDNLRLKISILSSVLRICVCSLVIVLIHGGITFISFYMSGLELQVIFAILSGFLSLFPFISSWIIWVPASLFLYYKGEFINSILVSSLHVAATYLIDPIIYSYIPNSNSYFSGLSIVFGLSSFGITGVIVGPMAFSTLVTMKDIYLQYIERPTQFALETPSPPNTPLQITNDPSNSNNKNSANNNNNSVGYSWVSFFKRDSPKSTKNVVSKRKAGTKQESIL